MNDLDHLLLLLKLEPRDLIRKNEPEFKTLHLANPNLTREQLIEAMVKHPKLIQRPIVVKNNKAIIARPAETILDLL